MRFSFIAGLAIALLVPSSLAAQARNFEVGGQIAIAASDLFGENDVGVGARIAWRPGLMGIEAELNVYPSNLPSSGVAVSGSRIEALFGATIGPRLGIIRPFARVRPGFVKFQEAPEPIACILIFPPPLSCQLAAGRTLFALDLGGGMDVAVGRTTLFRLDIGDRLVRFPAPYAIGHDVRVGIGWAVRF
jgi:hypothetical protein